LRENNLRLVFSRIAAAAPETPPSRADVADQTGLTKATVSSLVSTLIDSGMVTELPPAPTLQAGRPAIPLAIASGTMAGLGLEINVDFLGVRAVDLTGEIIDEAFEQVDLRQSEPETAFAAVACLAYHLIARLLDRDVRVLDACLALPGIADHPGGPLRLAPNLGWRDVDVRGQMAQACRRLAETGGVGAGDPVLDQTVADHTIAGARPEVTDLMTAVLVERLRVGNEANLAARTQLGRHRDESFIYVSGQTGIGAAIVVDGQVFRGSHGWAGEIGHIVIDPDGPTCACGASGCLETYAGKRSMLANANLDPHCSIADLLDAWNRDQPAARSAVEQAAEALGIALANCINLVDVARIVLGGTFAPLRRVLAEELSSQITTRVLSLRWMTAELEITASNAGPFASATGAALAVLDHAVADPRSPLWQR
jgi:predicted NBD/HSP70 family sugar kinase